ncbi:TetR/AcrR family transcriptional regulator [Paraflavitalea sp. CAU 1676]|uniref:TetR/AcrR family transcriptional regulator n=1 Tax=Paraflavitalea sp. CAU 1676 TaxID=3032598 RepID=UPI0023DB66E9|nr:TetR/AcrR family transcriptional regulator [Paraflavitalea sp. CAU 1676]MDF2187490.1 TetR/AcrR family transcriptional regulator [Paraflavitalea sp. CAU 1676]
MGITERKEKQKTELRRMILDASMKLFVEQGFENVSIRKIADLIDYSPTTVYLYFKDKDDILFNLHELGFQKMAEYNEGLWDIKNPLLRLHKMGENYIKFGVSHPEFYDLMFIQRAPMQSIEKMVDCEWKSGDVALGRLKDTIREGMDKELIVKGDVDAVSMAIWSMVHGLVSLSIRDRFNKLVPPDAVLPMMTQALNWLLETIDLTLKP